MAGLVALIRSRASTRFSASQVRYALWAPKRVLVVNPLVSTQTLATRSFASWDRSCSSHFSSVSVLNVSCPCVCGNLFWLSAAPDKCFGQPCESRTSSLLFHLMRSPDLTLTLRSDALLGCAFLVAIALALPKPLPVALIS